MWAGALVLITAWMTAWMAASGPAHPQRPPSPNPFTIGLLRRDGIVMPFATFDGREWSSPWPADIRMLQVPVSLQTVPARWWGKAGPFETMTLWVTGENHGSVRLERPTTVRVMCSPRIGLRSDYVSALPVSAQAQGAYPKEGVVVSGAAAIVEAVTPVPQDSPEWRASAALLVEPFEGAEAATARGFTDWKHPVPRSERRKVPLAIEALYRAPMDAEGWVAYRFQAIKRYPPSHGGDCELISSGSGWIVQGPAGKHYTQLSVRVTYCDRMDDIFTVPFGLVRAGGKSYWVYQLSGYDREGYAVSRPTPRAIETDVQYPAGSCPQ